MYSCYEGNGFMSQNGNHCRQTVKKWLYWGGPNRIGQGIEFDYACVHVAFSLAEEDIETIMGIVIQKRSLRIMIPRIDFTLSH